MLRHSEMEVSWMDDWFILHSMRRQKRTRALHVSLLHQLQHLAPGAKLSRIPDVNGACKADTASPQAC